MTAPLTPYDQQPPEPNGPAPDGKARVGRELVVGLVTTAAVAVTGLLLGLLWVWLAPRVPLVSDGSAVYLKDSEGEQAVGADGWFTLLGLGLGLLTALAVFRLRRGGGIAVVVGLVAGGAAASVIAWRFGMALGPTTNVVAHAKQAGANKVFDAPLVLHAKAALLTWPIAAALDFLALTALFTSEPPPAPWPAWGGPGPGYPQNYGPGYGRQTGSGEHWVSYTPSADPAPRAGEHPDTGRDGGNDGRDGRDDPGTSGAPGTPGTPDKD